MLDAQSKRWFYGAICVVVLALAGQAVFSSVALLRASADMRSRLSDVVAQYRGLEERRVKPLLALHLAAGERTRLEAIAGRMRALPEGDEAAGAITELQLALSDFFGRGGVSTDLETSDDFRQLNKEIGGYGEASVVLHNYNQAASAFMNAKATNVGGALSAILNMQDPILLYPNGRAKDAKLFL